MEKRRLKPEEWAAVRRRWEGSPEEGFEWLAKEIGSAWGVAITRPAVRQQATKPGAEWAKSGTPSDPLLPKVSVSRPAKVSVKAPPKVSTPKQPPAPPAPPTPPAPPPQTPPQTSPVPGRSKSAKRAPKAPDGVPPPNSRPLVPAMPQMADGQELLEGPPPEMPWIRKPAPVGRPTRYQPDFPDELIRFFDVSGFDVVVDNETQAAVRVPKTFPTLQRFASTIGVTTSTLYEWATAKNDEDGSLRHPEFSVAYARAREMQQALIIEGGMAGTYERTFAVLAAKNLAGWREKVEIDADLTLVNKEELETNFVREMEVARERQMKVLEERRAARGQTE